MDIKQVMMIKILITILYKHHHQHYGIVFYTENGKVQIIMMGHFSLIQQMINRIKRKRRDYRHFLLFLWHH